MWGAVYLCVYDQTVSRMSDVETSALAALPLRAGLLRGPDGGAGVVNVGGFYIRRCSNCAGRNGKDWLRLVETHADTVTRPLGKSDCWRR